MSRWLLSNSKDGDSKPLWATCGRAWSSSQWRSVSWCSEGISSVWEFGDWAHRLWSWHWVPPKRAWLCPRCTLPSDICTHWWVSSMEPSPFWTVPALSAFSHRTDDPVSSSPLWLCFGLSSVCPCLFCTWRPLSGPSTPDVTLPVLSRR